MLDTRPLFLEPRISPDADVHFHTQGVRLYLDIDGEDCWIELSPGYSYFTLMAAEMLVDSLGLEVMPPWECEPEELPSGNTRLWICEVEA